MLADGEFAEFQISFVFKSYFDLQGFLVWHRQAESQEGVQADSRCQAHQPRDEVNKDYY